MWRPPSLIALLAALCAAACSPALDWREFVPEGSGIGVSFPCRPDRHERSVELAGARLPMRMMVCSAADMTFAVSFVDVAEPARVGAVLTELRATAVRNVEGAAPQFGPWPLAGTTPNDGAGRLSVRGHLPDGAPVQAHAAFFARGLRVYQATVLGAAPTPAAVETFLGGLKF